MARRRGVEQRVNEALTVLNEMSCAGEGPETFRPSLAQRVSQEALLELASSLPSPTNAYSCRGAANELLANVVDYAGVDQGTTVRPYKRSLVSIPAVGESSAPLTSVAGELERDLLQRPAETMLADSDDVGWRSEKMSTIKPYMDVVLRSNKSEYISFL